MNRLIPCLALIAAGIAGAPAARALGGAAYVFDAPRAGGFTLAAAGQQPPICVAVEDYPGVYRAAADLAADIGRVTGSQSTVVRARPITGGALVIVGTIGHCALIDGLARDGKIDVTGVAGQWESWVAQVVPNPWPGVPQALVIAGSDKRGTIFGIYDLSEEIGVSPWYWWADVPVRHRNRLVVDSGRRFQGPPAVKYRGIFLNDEEPALGGWVREKFGGLNHRFYARVCELLLRLRANTLWPAMWNGAFAEDDPLNPQLADDYGIVMGTSHHEPMMRAQKEWQHHAQGPWDYTANGPVLRNFWATGVQSRRTYENLYTVGMRGDGDLPMSAATNVALLERIVADQRKILATEVNPDVTRVPQVWALYKEVQDYYDQGMRVPDDITLLWSDDNFGNLRRVPTAAERTRHGGSGIYYHVDYVGGPRSYKWICTVPIAKIWEQMNLAYRYGADRLWILNVGDLKPMEFDIEFFLSLARAPDQWPAERLGEFARAWAAREFGPEAADEIAAIETDYLKYIGRRKPEVLEPETYHLAHYREAERMDAEYRDLIVRAEAVGRRLPPAARDAYFELVLYPAKASAQVGELYLAAGFNQLFARQGRARANAMAARTRDLFQADADLSAEYNHDTAAGKWDHMMDQTHLGYTFWNQPPQNTAPPTREITLSPGPSMGIAVDGSDGAWPGSESVCALPPFDVFNRQQSFVDVFNRGQAGFDFTAMADQPWIRVQMGPSVGSPAAPARGAAVGARVEAERRVPVDIDWALVPPGTSRGRIVFTQTGGRSVTVAVEASRPAFPAGADPRGFVETGGVVAIEAAHATGGASAAGVAWREIPGYGRTLSSMALFPVTAPSAQPPAAPRLDYRLYLIRGGAANVETYLAPSLPFVPGRGLRYALAVDGGPPVTVEVDASASTPEWAQSVVDNVRIMRTPVTFAGPGAHTLTIWGIDPGVVLQKIVVNLGGEQPSYLGPPESFCWLGAAAAASSPSAP